MVLFMTELAGETGKDAYSRVKQRIPSFIISMQRAVYQRTIMNLCDNISKVTDAAISTTLSSLLPDEPVGALRQVMTQRVDSL